MIEDFFDHRCNIYYLQETTDAPAFGLPSTPAFGFNEDPDVSETICHFNIKGQSISIDQGAPANILDGAIKLVLPAGTVVHKNDKIVDVTPGADSFGQEYTAEDVHNIRCHHVYVNIKTKGRQGDL